MGSGRVSAFWFAGCDESPRQDLLEIPFGEARLQTRVDVERHLERQVPVAIGLLELDDLVQGPVGMAFDEGLTTPV